MANFTKVKLSGAGSQNLPLQVYLSDALGATTLHTTGTSSSTLDEIWIWAANDSAIAVPDVRIRSGGTLWYRGPVAANTTQLLVAGAIIAGDGSAGTVIEGFVTGSYTAYIFGYVNRIS